MSYESISLVFVIVSVLPVTFRASAERDRLGKNNRTYSVFEMKQFTPQQFTKIMQNRCKTLLCSALSKRIYYRRQLNKNGVVAMSFVSSSSFSGGVWGRRRVIRESFVEVIF